MNCMLTMKPDTKGVFSKFSKGIIFPVYNLACG